METGKELLDVRQVAAATGRSAETVRRWVWSGKLPFVRQGHRLFIERTALDGFLTAERGGPPMTLAQWAASLPPDPPGKHRARSAADLVIEDRRRRSEL